MIFLIILSMINSINGIKCLNGYCLEYNHYCIKGRCLEYCPNYNELSIYYNDNTFCKEDYECKFNTKFNTKFCSLESSSEKRFWIFIFITSCAISFSYFTCLVLYMISRKND